MGQLQSLVIKVKNKMMCHLNKSMHVLKQAPRLWYKKFKSFIVDNGFHKIHVDHYVFVKKFIESDFLILLLYVDDMLIVGRDSNKIVSL